MGDGKGERVRNIGKKGETRDKERQPERWHEMDMKRKKRKKIEGGEGRYIKGAGGEGG